MRYDVVNVGDALPPIVTKPISRTTLALFAGASGDHNPIHIDIDFARKAGMPDVFAHGMLSMAFLGRLLTGWVPPSAIREFSTRFVAITQVHAIITCTGQIAEKLDGNRVRLEIQAADQNGDVKLAGGAIIVLP
ncbi:MaoC family dehydratase [Aliisedimentitalea scapharcae]|uniref:MaoC family dehydratase n=1 Tax=Aliisedimentitalea scapharcae TaxID=1524259 RepID=A0ABZ2XV77_9RHOB